MALHCVNEQKLETEVSKFMLIERHGSNRMRMLE